MRSLQSVDELPRGLATELSKDGDGEAGTGAGEAGAGADAAFDGDHRTESICSDDADNDDKHDNDDADDNDAKVYSAYLTGLQKPHFIFHAAGHCGKLEALRGMMGKCGIPIPSEFLEQERFKLDRDMRSLKREGVVIYRKTGGTLGGDAAPGDDAGDDPADDLAVNTATVAEG